MKDWKLFHVFSQRVCARHSKKTLCLEVGMDCACSRNNAKLKSRRLANATWNQEQHSPSQNLRTMKPLTKRRRASERGGHCSLRAFLTISSKLCRIRPVTVCQQNPEIKQMLASHGLTLPSAGHSACFMVSNIDPIDAPNGSYHAGPPKRKYSHCMQCQAKTPLDQHGWMTPDGHRKKCL